VSDDIVTRLRDMACCWRGNDPIAIELRQAADEMERLRRNVGCARHQRSTQFCAEALDAQREAERLREERDDARRAIITLLAGTDIRNMHRLADERGWDCFKDKACGLCDQPSDAVNGHGDCMNCAKDQYGA
jgi:hypothetical protein